SLRPDTGTEYLLGGADLQQTQSKNPTGKGREAVSGNCRRLRDNGWCFSQIKIQRTGNAYTDNAARMVSEGDRCGADGAYGHEPAEICFFPGWKYCEGRSGNWVLQQG